MDRKLLGKRINMARKDRGMTSERLSDACHINATYLRQIEGGTKTPSLPVFVSLCEALKGVRFLLFSGASFIVSGLPYSTHYERCNNIPVWIRQFFMRSQ